MGIGGNKVTGLSYRFMHGYILQTIKRVQEYMIRGRNCANIFSIYECIKCDNYCNRSGQEYNCDLKNDQFISLCNQTQLTGLFLSKNNITNIDSVTNLIDLSRFDIRLNDVSDISSLSSLSNLEWLRLQENNIMNISPLKNLSKLRYVDLIGCPIEDLDRKSVV